MKKMKKFLQVMSAVCVIVLSLTSSSLALPQSNNRDNPTREALFIYLSAMLGVSEKNVETLYQENINMDSFMAEIDAILEEIAYYEEWETSNDEVENLASISAELDVEEAILQRHISLVGKEYFLRNISSLINEETAVPLSDGTSEGAIDPEVFERFYQNAHTGNLFVTKDSVRYGYRHGHVGIISEHTSASNKMITEALGDFSKHADTSEEAEKAEAEEVVVQPLRKWATRKTMGIYYPTNTSVEQRERAGLYGSYLDYCTYRAIITKGQAVDLMPEVSCISLVYLSYIMSTNSGTYDLLPEVGNSSLLLPAQIVSSSNITVKVSSDMIILRTDNWYDYDWGFNWI